MFGIFPNSRIEGVGNKVKIEIPPEDIEKAILMSYKEEYRKYMNVKSTENGIVINFNIGNLLKDSGKSKIEFEVNPEIIEIKIPSESLVRTFADKYGTIDVKYENGKIVVIMDIKPVS